MVLILTVVLVSTQKLTPNKNHRFFFRVLGSYFLKKFESLFVKNHGSYKKNECITVIMVQKKN